MEHWLHDGSAPVGREKHIYRSRVYLRREPGLLEEFSSSGGDEAGVARVQVPAERPPPQVAVVTGEEHQPTIVDDDDTGHEVGAAAPTDIEERQCPCP